MIESKGWHLFCEHQALGFVDIVKEFYANMVGTKDKAVYVRGRWVSFNREQINQPFNLRRERMDLNLKDWLKRLTSKRL